MDMNESLCKKIPDEEISDAVFLICPVKAPGPNGFPTRFYQYLLKRDVIKVVRQVHRWFYARRN
jgi:hypothetical protein